MARGPRSNVVGLDRARRSAIEDDFAGRGNGDFPLFYSILFARPEDRIGVDALQAPEFFADLNCDQIVDAITAGKDDYNLKPFFYACLQAYRCNPISSRSHAGSRAVHRCMSASAVFASRMREAA